MTPIIIDLPMPPSANKLTRNVPGVGRAHTSEYTSWRREAGWLIRAARPGQITGNYRMSLVVSHELRARHGDLNNRIKAVEDILVEMGVVEDDSFCVGTETKWGDVVGVRVELRAAP